MTRASKADWVEIAIVIPVLILVGTYVVGITLEGFLGRKNMFAIIFTEGEPESIFGLPLSA
jgi:hypothetical protein